MGYVKNADALQLMEKLFLAVLHLLSGVRNADLVLVMEVIK
jgi:hypothetical protein|nr:MAG TPA: hypothetical protein [Caudoviricetes sp.]